MFAALSEVSIWKLYEKTLKTGRFWSGPVFFGTLLFTKEIKAPSYFVHNQKLDVERHVKFEGRPASGKCSFSSGHPAKNAIIRVVTVTGRGATPKVRV